MNQKITLNLTTSQANLLTHLLAEAENHGAGRLTLDGRNMAGQLFDQINWALTSLPMTKHMVNIDGIPTDPQVVSYQHEWDTWNGFDCPYFEKDAFMAWANITGTVATYDRNTDTIGVYDEANEMTDTWKGADFLTVDGMKHLYAVGAWGWCWSTIEPEEN